MPLLNEAPGGNETVSMTDVVEMSFGSEMSDFWIDFLRTPRDRNEGIPEVTGLPFVLLEKEDIMGVEDADIGGVGFEENGNGDALEDGAEKPGLRGPTDRAEVGDWEGAGEESPGKPTPLVGAKPGEGRGEGSAMGFGGGHKPFCSNVAASGLF